MHYIKPNQSYKLVHVVMAVRDGEESEICDGINEILRPQMNSYFVDYCFSIGKTTHSSCLPEEGELFNFEVHTQNGKTHLIMDYFGKLKTWEVTYPGYDSSREDTDHLVKWVHAPSEESVRKFTTGKNARFEPITHRTEGIDFVLDPDGNIIWQFSGILNEKISGNNDRITWVG